MNSMMVAHRSWCQNWIDFIGGASCDLSLPKVTIFIAIHMQVQPADEDRQFVLSYFMNDDTISVFEPPIRNSGMIGGKFLERGIKYKTGTEEQYTYKDLYVGAEIVINNFNFLLANADEYTFSYMENNKHLFIMGDGQAVLTLLKAQVAVCCNSVHFLNA